MFIAHVDMDCFFCACEEKRNPKLKGKPVIVGSTGQRGVVSTSNYEARKFEVFSATPISIARKRCPDGIYLPVDFTLYRKESISVMMALRMLADDVYQVSVDEAYLDIRSLVQEVGSPEKAATTIQEAVKERTGLSCSVGISPCKVVSKIASDFKKPGGLTVVADTKAFLAPLPIKKFPGIGKVSVEHYEHNGIHTIGDLAKKDRFWVLDHFGKHGVYYHKIARGEQYIGLPQRSKRKSVSKEHTFLIDEGDIQAIENKIRELSAIVHQHLHGKAFKTVSIKVRYTGFITQSRDFTLKAPRDDKETIERTALKLFNALDITNKIRLIGVKTSQLIHEPSRQLTLQRFR
ncbi:DNA polymerase IV [Candidatus Woesearchaeota archaeon]|nr:DNA polymerase IV [Candidatus Woesearchaeota archaeon]